MKPNSKLTPQEVRTMPLDTFEKRFGFRPVDALEKEWFTMLGKRIDQLSRDMIAAGIIPPGDLSQVIMK